MLSWSPGTTAEQRAAILKRHEQESNVEAYAPKETQVVSIPTGQVLPITGHKVCNHYLIATHLHWLKDRASEQLILESFTYGPHNGSHDGRSCFWKADASNKTRIFNSLYGI